jgi:hypothetical protein
MKTLYNSVINIVKKQDSELIFAYCFAAIASGLLLWHIVDKIIAFSVVSSELKLIFT